MSIPDSGQLFETTHIVISALKNITLPHFRKPKIVRLAHARHNCDSGTAYANRSVAIFIVLSALENIPLRHFGNHHNRHIADNTKQHTTPPPN